MKKTNYFVHNIIAGAFALAMMALVAKTNAESVPQAITVIKVEGQARYSVDNHNWTPLQRGDVLKPGAVIQTAEKSKVDIMLGEIRSALMAPPTAVSFNPAAGNGGGGDSGPKANIVRIFASSVVAIDKLIVEKTGVDEVSETQLDLRAGKIMGNVKKLSAASRYEVKIPNGVAGIRGTIYEITATGVVFVLEGQVIISYTAGDGSLHTKTVSAGEEFNPFVNAAGQPTTTPDVGQLGPIPPTVLKTILDDYHDMTGSGVTTPSGDYTINNTLIHISTSPSN